VDSLVGLLSHGLAYGDEEMDALFARLRDMQPIRELREDWEYDNLTLALTVRTFAHSSRMPYTTFVGEGILQPLGMNRSTFCLTNAPKLGPFSQSCRWVSGPGGEAVVRFESPFIEETTTGLMAGVLSPLLEL